MSAKRAPDGQRRTVRVSIFLTEEKHAALVAKHGKKLGAVVRQALDDAEATADAAEGLAHRLAVSESHREQQRRHLDRARAEVQRLRDRYEPTPPAAPPALFRTLEDKHRPEISGSLWTPPTYRTRETTP